MEGIVSQMIGLQKSLIQLSVQEMLLCIVVIYVIGTLNVLDRIFRIGLDRLVHNQYKKRSNYG